MFTEQDLQELMDFRSEGDPVLSLYLNVDPTQHTKDEYKLILKGLLKEVADEASPQDIAEVERYFDFQYDWQGRGVAIFSCMEEGFWRAYSLAVPVKNHVFVADRPYIKPFTDVLDAYGRYGVVLVDREGARLFLFQLGELREASGTFSEGLKHHKQGGWAQARYQRHVDELAQQNLRRAAELTAEFCQKTGCDRLILGGTEDNLAQFKGMLPKALQEQVVGSFSIDITAPETEVLARSLEVIKAAEKQGEEELVERMITAAAQGGAGVSGLDGTLGGVAGGRVHILLVAEGYRAKGYLCSKCGYITAQKKEKCPFCGGEVRQIDDAVDLIVRRVLDSGGQVEVVEDSPALEKAGSIGAILRY